MEFNKNGSILFNTHKENKKLKLILNKCCNNILLEEEILFTESTISIYKNNKDIFKIFYNENIELYNEIDSKVQRIVKF